MISIFDQDVDNDATFRPAEHTYSQMIEDFADPESPAKSEATQPVARIRKLQRIGEGDSFVSTEHAERNVEGQKILGQNTIQEPKARSPTDKMAIGLNADPTPTNTQPLASDDDDDGELDRQIDVDLDQLSESVARLRRLALAMGRELEMQNQRLARLWTKAVVRTGGDTIGGLWQKGSLDSRE
jgi:hypothetical protein